MLRLPLVPHPPRHVSAAASVVSADARGHSGKDTQRVGHRGRTAPPGSVGLVDVPLRESFSCGTRHVGETRHTFLLKSSVLSDVRPRQQRPSCPASRRLSPHRLTAVASRRSSCQQASGVRCSLLAQTARLGPALEKEDIYPQNRSFSERRLIWDHVWLATRSPRLLGGEWVF